MSSLVRYSRWASQFKNQSRMLSSFLASTTEPKLSQPSPPPVRVGFTESAGRGVFATRSIAAGELIHTAEPIVSHPSLSCLHSVCYVCLKRLPVTQNHCSTRQTKSFCSDKCRDQSEQFYEFEKKADWSKFDAYCRMQGLKYPLVMKRLACQVITGAVAADCLDILQPATLSSDMIQLIEKEFHLLRGTFEDSDIKCDQMEFLTKEWYIGALARIRINAFRVEFAGGSYEDFLKLAAASVEAEAGVGTAVYMLPSFYNHDCDPNAHVVWIDNVKARLKALRDVEAGEELRICYIDASMDHEARQAVLYEGFGFQCSCLRCRSKY